jgi:hypothetical protein
MTERLFNFTNIFRDYSEYVEIKDELKSVILNDYKFRKNQAKIMIGNDVIDANYGRVLINLLIMKPFVGKGLKLSANDLFGFESVTEGNLNQYFDGIISRFKSDVDIDFDDLRKIIGETINEMSDISGELNVLSGNSISFHDFVKLSAENEEARSLFNQKIDKKMEFNDIEDKFNKLGKDIEKFFKENKDTELFPFMTSGTGINRKQLTQAIGFVGLKPDIDGSIIPVTIEDNYLNGLTSLENYFINAKGTRKALITNNKQVRRSGYLTRKLSLSMVDRYHDNSFKDCKTEHLIIYNITDAEKLVQIEGRHYHDINDNNEKISELKTLRYTDTNLIGKTIGLRSPVTCAGDHVCKTCYGSDLSEINRDLNSGLIAVNFLTEPLTQKLLSAKHLLTTNTEKVAWGDIFEEKFLISMNLIYFADNEINIVFNKSDIQHDEEDDMSYIEKFKIYEKSKLIADYEAPETSDRKKIRFTLDEKYLEKKDMEYNEETDQFIINSKNFGDDDYVFTFQAKNNELTKSLEQIVDLIETVNHLGMVTYHDMVNKFSDLIIENGLNINSVHTEMIVSNLIRDKQTGKRLDFSKKDLNQYDIIRVSKSIMNGPLSVSLGFERIDEQLVDLSTYEKNEESLMDYLFR